MITIQEDRFTSSFDIGTGARANAATVFCLADDVPNLPTTLPNGTFCFAAGTGGGYYVFDAENSEWKTVGA